MIIIKPEVAAEALTLIIIRLLDLLHLPLLEM
jgi:hypothetical protein